MNNVALENAGKLIGRILLALIFIRSGWGKIGGYEGAMQYMAAAGLPGLLLPLVIALELGGGLLVLIGWQTRLAALALAAFTLATAFLFHLKTGDANQMVHFWKNIAIAGGFLVLFGSGAGAWSIDGDKKRA